MYRCWDLIIGDFELNMAYRLSVEPSDVGSEQVGGGERSNHEGKKLNILLSSVYFALWSFYRYTDDVRR